MAGEPTSGEVRYTLREPMLHVQSGSQLLVVGADLQQKRTFYATGARPNSPTDRRVPPAWRRCMCTCSTVLVRLSQRYDGLRAATR